MESYSSKEISPALEKVGIQAGDLVYVSTGLHGLGPMSDARNKEDFLEKFFKSILDIIGEKGTIVVKTYTQQVAQFGLPYIHEETESLTGIFGEYIRLKADSLRSLHPVFSVSAYGHHNDYICRDISRVGFGYDSAFHRLVEQGGKLVCIGLPLESAQIVTLVHHVETMYGVPYYYNKIIDSPVYYQGKEVNEEFVINVKYRKLEVDFDFQPYIQKLESENNISATVLGDGLIHAADIKTVFNTGISLLKNNIYAFLASSPRYVDGEIPKDGSLQSSGDKDYNWSGFHLGL